MRLWSIHPMYLDQKGLCGLWRESLLAQNVLLKGKGSYYNHPQLNRFKVSNGLQYLTNYLFNVADEGKKRKYRFDINKIKCGYVVLLDQINVTVTQDQLLYEFKHLQMKLIERDWKKYSENLILSKREIKAHPIFEVVKGSIESWEKVHV